MLRVPPTQAVEGTDLNIMQSESLGVYACAAGAELGLRLQLHHCGKHAGQQQQEQEQEIEAREQHGVGV